MIARPSAKIIEALAFLEGSSRFDDVLEWLKESEAETMAALVAERDADELRRLQGAAHDLREILKLARKARELTSKN